MITVGHHVTTWLRNASRDSMASDSICLCKIMDQKYLNTKQTLHDLPNNNNKEHTLPSVCLIVVSVCVFPSIFRSSTPCTFMAGYREIAFAMLV